MSAQPETIDGLTAEIAELDRQIDAAATAGKPTTRLEESKAAFKRRRDALVQADADKARAARQAENDQIEGAAKAEADAIVDRVASVLPEILIKIPDVDRESIIVAARAHARAELEVVKLTAVLLKGRRKPPTSRLGSSRQMLR